MTAILGPGGHHTDWLFSLSSVPAVGCVPQDELAALEDVNQGIGQLLGPAVAGDLARLRGAAAALQPLLHVPAAPAGPAASGAGFTTAGLGLLQTSLVDSYGRLVSLASSSTAQPGGKT